MSKITPADFFSLLEMIDKKVVLSMNVLTYKKIIGTAMGYAQYQQITKVIPMINGVSIEFDETKPNNAVTIQAQYIPHSQDFMQIEIL